MCVILIYFNCTVYKHELYTSFTINLQLLPLHTSLPFIPCFAHKKEIILFLFSILFFLLVNFFFFFWILSCTFSLGWSGLVLCFLITPSSLSWLWFNFFFFWGSRNSSLNENMEYLVMYGYEFKYAYQMFE